jgi:fructosamine-3-kinase
MFGRGLAALHNHRIDKPGWSQDVFIGPLPQSNEAANWPEFWANHRLRPMAERAGRSLDSATRRLIEQVCEACPTLLADVDHLGPLHGDLWAGNALWTESGAMLIDPAVYVGDPEVDLAMMALFGGFPDAAWSSYHQVRPRTDGFDVRRALYQMWPLLVHVALFGSSYCRQTAAAARQVLAAA